MDELYVYIHVDRLTGLVIYCGKGCKKQYLKGQYISTYDRAYDNTHRPYKIDDTILVLKVKYFDNATDAYAYETLLTSFYKLCGQCWYNSNIGLIPNDETKNKCAGDKRNSYTKTNNPMYGRVGANNPCFKGYIVSPELNAYVGYELLFEGVKDAEVQCKKMNIKVDKSSICKVIKGTQQTCGTIIHNNKKIKLTWQRK